MPYIIQNGQSGQVSDDLAEESQQSFIEVEVKLPSEIALGEVFDIGSIPQDARIVGVGKAGRSWTKEPPEADAFRAAARALLAIATPADAAVMLSDEIELATKAGNGVH